MFVYVYFTLLYFTGISILCVYVLLVHVHAIVLYAITPLTLIYMFICVYTGILSYTSYRPIITTLFPTSFPHALND